MKNIHVIDNKIYITSNEGLVLNDYHFNSKYGDEPQKTNQRDIDSRKYWEEESYYIQKIILTTDQDLIKDGVQAISDEFLEWFAKNPSCEEVKIENDYLLWKTSEIEKLSDCYKIIIPKQEPKKQCEHEFVTKYGVSECQNCGIEESEIISIKNQEAIKVLLKHKSYFEELINKDYKQLVFDIEYKIFMLSMYYNLSDDFLETKNELEKLENEKWKLLNSYKNFKDGHYQKQLEKLNKEIEQLKQNN